jgi:hypothetical protein
MTTNTFYQYSAIGSTMTGDGATGSMYITNGYPDQVQSVYRVGIGGTFGFSLDYTAGKPSFMFKLLVLCFDVGQGQVKRVIDLNDSGTFLGLWE